MKKLDTIHEKYFIIDEITDVYDKVADYSVVPARKNRLSVNYNLLFSERLNDFVTSETLRAMTFDKLSEERLFLVAEKKYRYLFCSGKCFFESPYPENRKVERCPHVDDCVKFLQEEKKEENNAER